MEHTKGPWTLSQTRNAGQFVVECETNVPGVKNTVATCGYKPNAQLIAAAPRVLAALRRVTQDRDEDGGLSLSELALAIAEEAIAEAEGTNHA